MAPSIRLFSIIAILLGGMFGLKAISVTNGTVDLLSARAEAATMTVVVADADEEVPAQAEAIEEAPAEEPEAAPEPAPDATAAFERRIASGIRTQEEESVIRALGQRRAELDSREAELDTREALMLAMEQRVDGKIEELNGLRGQIETLVGQLSEREEEDMSVIVAWYNAMDARNAATLIPALDPTVQVQIASRMTARKFGEILGAMEPASAAALTQLMASRGDLPETLDELEERLAEDS